MKYSGQAFTFYRACWWLGFCLAKLLFRLKIQGAHQVPPRGGVIFASNHVSFIDPAFIGVAAVRELFYVTKRESLGVPGLGRLLTSLNAIPIDRSRGDRGALSAYEGILVEGGAIYIAPEGTRNKKDTFLDPKPGAGLLVYRTGVPVVPVYVGGTMSIVKCLLGLETVTLRFGDPVTYDRSRFGDPSRFGGARKDIYRAISLDIMARIQELKQGRPNAGAANPASSV
jgi:1-acyl-sn-glycerol-3-phosphate acyltransferase